MNMFSILFILILTISSVAGSIGEYHLKALYLIRFTSFIEWPNSSTMKSHNDVNVGVITNRQETINDLKSFFRFRKIKNRDVRIIRINKLSDISDIEILYIDKNHDFTLDQILKKSTSEMLVIGDSSNMVEEGAAISFYLLSNKLRFRINKNVIDSLGFKVSSYLLELADIYPAQSTGGGKNEN